MKSAFLDTVGLIAVWDKADQWHDDRTGLSEPGQVGADAGHHDVGTL